LNRSLIQGWEATKPNLDDQPFSLKCCAVLLAAGAMRNSPRESSVSEGQEAFRKAGREAGVTILRR